MTGEGVPPLAHGECQVWWTGTHLADPRLAGLLDDEERGRWERFRHDGSRDLYLVAHALARLVLAAHTGTAPQRLDFNRACARCGGQHGKPRLRAGGAHLSLSHSGTVAVVAVTRDAEIGVDVERIALRDADIPDSALAEQELAALRSLPADERTEGFIRYWTRKEAVLKATGDGLSVGLRGFAVSPPDAPAALLTWSEGPAPAAHLDDIAAPAGYLGCLASLGSRLRVVERDGDALLNGWGG